MPIIVKIGYQEWLVKNEAAAFSAIKALTGAVRVQSRHVGTGKTFRQLYWPDNDHENELSLKTVNTNQLVARDPGESDPFEEPKQLPFRTTKA